MAIIFFWVFAVDPNPQDDRRVALLNVIRRREFWIITVLWTFASASALGIYSVIPLFLVKERNLSMDLANTVFGISRIGGFCVPVLAGLFVDRFGVKRILFLVFIVTGLSTIGLALAKTFPLLVAMLLLQGAVYSSFFPVGQVVISRFTSLRERSAFIGGTMATAGIFGVGLTPLILGAIADAWNFQSGILVLGILTCLSCLSLAFLQIETEG